MSSDKFQAVTPYSEKVLLMGDFNQRDENRHPMKKIKRDMGKTDELKATADKLEVRVKDAVPAVSKIFIEAQSLKKKPSTFKAQDE